MRLLIPALVALALAVAGCGGGEGGGTAAAQPSRAEAGYVAQADAICKRANEEEAALVVEDDASWILDEQFDDPEFLETFTAVGARAVERLRDLEPPAEDREQAAAMMAALDRMTEALQDRAREVSRGRGRRAAELRNQYVSGYSDLVVAAGPLGLSECQGLLL